MENRNLLRDGVKISVACRSLIANSRVLKGKMLDCSCKGTCMEENPPILPEGFRSFALAEVKWSKPLEGKGGHNYAIGLRYLPN
jgi:hypothetical protein